MNDWNFKAKMNDGGKSLNKPVENLNFGKNNLL